MNIGADILTTGKQRNKNIKKQTKWKSVKFRCEFTRNKTQVCWFYSI